MREIENDNLFSEDVLKKMRNGPKKNESFINGVCSTMDMKNETKTNFGGTK